MKAVVCETLSSAEQPVLRRDWTLPPTGDDQVRIAVRAAALNFPDLLMLAGKYQIRPPLPFVPGGEAAGVVVETGCNVSGIKPGDEVLFSGVTGAFCEQVLATQDQVLPMPAGLTCAQAAGCGIAYLTAYYALKQRANLQAGETLLVLGAGGGVGLAAVEIGRLMGARVIAAASDNLKLDAAKAKGADLLLNYGDAPLKDQLKVLAGKHGVDVVVDPVGGDFSETAMRAMAWNGRFLVVGFAAGDIPRMPLHLCLLKGCSIIGVSSGEFPIAEPELHRQNLSELWAHFGEGRLSPVVGASYPVEQFKEAFADMAERRAIGKIVLEFDS